MRRRREPETEDYWVVQCKQRCECGRGEVNSISTRHSSEADAKAKAAKFESWDNHKPTSTEIYHVTRERIA